MRKGCILVVVVLGFGMSVGHAGERTEFPPAARAQYQRGQELLKNGKYRKAREAFDEAIRLGMNDFPRAHLGRANANRKLKDLDAAIRQYTQFIERFGLEESCRY